MNTNHPHPIPFITKVKEAALVLYQGRGMQPQDHSRSLIMTLVLDTAVQYLTLRYLNERGGLCWLFWPLL